MAQIQLGGYSGAAFTSFPRHVVQTCETWGDWSTVPYLECVQCVDAVAPSVGQATLVWSYGTIKRENAAAFASVADLDLRGHWVRVVAQFAGGGVQPIWHGRIDADETEIRGADAPGGEQFIFAFGLGHELDRTPLDRATVLLPDGTTEATIRYMPALNRRDDGAYAGNRSAAVGADGYYLFGGDDVWTNQQAAEMLIGRHAPANGPTWSLGGALSALEQLSEVMALDGQTIWGALNQLVRSSLGLGFAVRVLDDEAVIQVFSHLAEDLSVGWVSVPANAEQVALDTANQWIRDVRLGRNRAARYDEIEAVGERIVVCGTFSVADGNLERGWTAGEESEYQDGGKASPNYTAMHAADKAAMNDAVRRTEALRHVFCKLRVPSKWDGKVKDEGNESANIVPACSESAEISYPDGAPLMLRGKRFLTWVPVGEDTDEETWRRLQAWVACPTGKYSDRDKTQEILDYQPTDAPGEDWADVAAHAHLYPGELAVLLTPRVPHVYGLTHWAGAELSDHDPVADYEQIRVTAAFETDAVLRYVARRAGATDTTSGLRRKRVYVRDCAVWLIAPHTVTKTEPEVKTCYAGTPPVSGAVQVQRLHRTTDWDIVRDDRARLEAVAAGALAWYSQERSALSLVYHGAGCVAPVGALLVATASGVPVNTAITSVGVDFRAGTTTVQTGFAELDFGEWRP